MFCRLPLCAVVMVVWSAAGASLAAAQEWSGVGDGPSERWRASLENANYLAVRWDVVAAGGYRLEFHANATWASTRAWLILGSLVREASASHIEKAFVASDSETTCERGPADHLECPLRTVTKRFGAASSGRLYPGSYVAYVAAFGANATQLELRWTFEGRASNATIAEGAGRLVELVPGGAGEDGAHAFFESTVPFLGHFHAAGGVAREPEYQASGPNGRSFRFQECNVFYCLDERGEPSRPVFPASPGAWSMASRGGPGDTRNERPMVSLVGILFRFPLVDEAGFLEPIALSSCRPSPEVASSKTLGPDTPSSGRGWPTFRGNLARTGTTAAATHAGAARVVNLGVPITASPSSDGQSVVVAAGAPLPANAATVGRLVAFDARLATVLWEVPIASTMESSPALAHGLAVVGTDGGDVYAFSMDNGSLQWATHTGSGATSSPAIDASTVVVGTGGRRLLALDLATGDVTWAWTMCAAILGAPSIDSMGVVAASTDGFVGSWALHSGALQWERTLDDAILSSPLLVDELAFVGTQGGMLYALHRADGSPRWSVRLDGPVFGSPAWADGSVVVGTLAGTVYSVDATVGTARWNRSLGAPLYATPAVSGGAVVVAAFDGTVARIDSRDGLLLERRSVGAPLFASPLLLGSVVVVADQTGDVRSLGGTGARTDGPGLVVGLGAIALALAVRRWARSDRTSRERRDAAASIAREGAPRSAA